MTETKTISILVIGQYGHRAALAANGWRVVSTSDSPEGPAFVRVTLRRDNEPVAPAKPAKPKPMAKIKPKTKPKAKKKTK